MKIILGSSSPRRQQLLSQLGYKFEIIKPETEEKIRDGEGARAYVNRNAREKLDDIVSRLKEKPSLVICGDTIVCLNDEVLEKPTSKNDAHQMIRKLSGNKHTVISAMAVMNVDSAECEVFDVLTDVYFKDLTDEEILKYIDTGEPMDKAGSYALQGIGSYMVRKIEGSYSNVIGMPVCELWETLNEKFGVAPNV